MLSTRHKLEDEIWCLIDYYSEIEEKGIEFIKNLGIKRYPKYKSVFNLFQAFIRQAKSYYSSANKLPYRSSSLLYYYSFLNFVKAYLLLSNPDNILSKRITHGMYRPKENKPFQNQAVKIQSDGVFPLFYEKETGNKITKRLKIVNLLSYCREITTQFEDSGYGKSSIIPCRFSILSNTKEKTIWSIIAIPLFQQLSRYNKIIKNIKKYYQEFELDPYDFQNLFKMYSGIHHEYKFFQSRKIRSFNNNINYELGDELIKAFKNAFDENFYPDNNDFFISLPYSINDQFEMNELMSIYCIMFYLGDLVRYNPDYMEKLIYKKSSWIIESFVRCSPLIFLNKIVSKILKTDYIIKRV